jgi:hypothetical protein
MGKLDSNIKKGSGTQTSRCCDNQHHGNLVSEGAMPGGTKIGGVHDSWDLRHQREARHKPIAESRVRKQREHIRLLTKCKPGFGGC